MKTLVTVVLILSTICVKAQIGIGTTSPNSTLDVRGALSLNLRVFTGTTTSISSTDNTVIFTGTAASTATLPDATACTGRMYRIKNASITSPTPALTIATTSSQTIDGISSWVLDEGYGSIAIVSNGTNWLISSQSVPKSSGSAWLQGGNSVSAVKNMGTTSNYDLPFITNNTEKMRLTASGNLGIGTTTFNGTYPERFLVDAGATGNTNYQNVIVGKGNTNSYAQLNIQNSNTGTAASSDVIATADNGNETVNFMDLGINSSTNSQNYFGGLNDAYLYTIGNGVNTGGNLFIGTATPSRDIAFLTGGGTMSSGVTMNNERMRILGTGNVGINTNTPNSTLDVRGALSLNLRVFTGTTTSISSTDNTVIFTGTAASTATLPDATACTGRMYRIKNASITSPTPALTIATTSSQTIDGISSWVLDEGYGSIAIVSNGTNWLISSQSVPKSSGSAWLQGGNSVSAVKNMGTTSNYDLPFITNNTEKMRLTASGNLGIGTTTFNGTYPERFLVDAGATGNTNYQNVIVGKGNTNSYAQLNIQNSNTGTAASSDVVATADNGNETVNFIDQGINSSTNSQNYFGGLNDAYLYAIGNGVNTGGNLYIGTATASRDIAFLTGGGTKSSGVTMNNERMRILGTGNVGINTNSPNSNLEVNGSMGFSITTTTANLTLNATHYTVIVTGGTPTITLPAASGCNRRVYIIVNETGSNVNLSASYINLDASTLNTLGGGNSITIQSNGTSWYRIQ